MAFWTNVLQQIGAQFVGSFPGLNGLLLKNADGSADVLQGDGSGGALVTIKGGTLTATVDETTLAKDATLVALSAKMTACNTGAVTVSSCALPTGAALDASVTAMSAKLPAALGAGAGSASLSVVPCTDTATPTTQYHATTPTRSDSGSGSTPGPMETNSRGLAFVVSLPRHRRKIPTLAGGTWAALAAFAEGHCDVVKTDTDSVILYAQAPESPWVVVAGDFSDASKWTANAGWTISTSGKTATHAASGGTGSLTQATASTNTINPIVVGEPYLVITYIKSISVGSVTPYLGTTAGTAITAQGWNAQVIVAQSATLSYTPTTTTDAVIGLSATAGDLQLASVCLPATDPLYSGQWEPLPCYLIGGVAASSTPATLLTNATTPAVKLEAGWIRRSGATGLG